MGFGPGKQLAKAGEVVIVAMDVDGRIIAMDTFGVTARAQRTLFVGKEPGTFNRINRGSNQFFQQEIVLPKRVAERELPFPIPAYVRNKQGIVSYKIYWSSV